MPKKPISLGREFAEAMSISIELVVPVILGAYLGYKIDERFKTYPWCLILGVVLGGVSGLWTVYKVVVTDKK